MSLNPQFCFPISFPTRCSDPRHDAVMCGQIGIQFPSNQFISRGRVCRRWECVCVPDWKTDLMVFPVLNRIHCGMGRFCFCAFASFCFVRNDLWLCTKFRVLVGRSNRIECVRPVSVSRAVGASRRPFLERERENVCMGKTWTYRHLDDDCRFDGERLCGGEAWNDRNLDLESRSIPPEVFTCAWHCQD